MQVLELSQTPREDGSGAGSGSGLTGAGHPSFISGQFHPELTGRPLSPQPLFMGLLAAAIREKVQAEQGDEWRNDPMLAKWVREPATGVQTVVTPSGQRSVQT